MSVQYRCTICPKITQDQKNRFRCTRWNRYVTWAIWNLVSVRLEIVLILTQDKCTVCAERTIGSEFILDALDGTPR
jgi:hypothetical protein